MDWELTYELKQQTPLIHFQHNQTGATLRATEVRPKLDKFIIKKMGGKDKVPSEWFIKDTSALNYKMRIVTTGKPEISQAIDFALKLKKENDILKSIGQKSSPQKKALDNSLKAQINEMYFGNMVSDKETDYEDAVRENYKETVFYGEDTSIQLKITCFIPELRKAIADNIEEFFFVHNFGTRQSKGFGGFVVKTEQPCNPIKVLTEQGYKFFYADIRGGSADHTTMLNHAKNIYAVMKGGYNHTGWNEKEKKYKFTQSYIKGYIQKAFLTDFGYVNTGSDKAAIKNKKELCFDKKTGQKYVYPKERRGQPHEYKYDSYTFVRALLGLADHYEFRSERKGNVEIFSLGEKDFDVERFRSPVTIKIIDNKLIFLFGCFDKICCKTFYFAPNGIPKNVQFDKKTYTEKKTYITENSDEKGNQVFISVPTVEKFDDDDIIKFINCFVMYFKKNKQKLSEFSNSKIKTSKDLEIIVPQELRREY